jgi:hypothetical protein
MLRKFLTVVCMVILTLSAGCQQAVEDAETGADLTMAGFSTIFNVRDLTG